MSLKDRFIAWLLWRLNGWKSVDDARFECIEHPEVSIMASLCRDRFYVLQAKEIDGKCNS